MSTVRLIRSNNVAAPATRMFVPNVAGNFAKTPNAAANQITGDIDIRAKLTLVSWASGVNQWIISKSDATASNFAYDFRIGTGGQPALRWSPDGTTGAILAFAATVATGFAANSTHWVRVTLQVNDGGGNRVCKFFTSDDGVTWTQLGITQTTAGTTVIFAGTSQVEVGAVTTNVGLAGTIQRAQLFAGINGTLKVDFDPRRAIAGQVSFVAITGERWTLARAGSTPARFY